MSECLNKWFWVKNDDGIFDPQERERWWMYSRNSLQCVDEKNDVLTLYYANENITIHAKKDCVEERPAPVFLRGDVVLIVKKQVQAIVKYSIWHFNGGYYFYHLEDENGKMLKKRYLANELKKLEQSK